MLSIGKVGSGRADPSYYLDRVAQGADDYYAGAGEAPGQWHGTGAIQQGLTGTVDDEAFVTALQANPADGKTVLGYDLTFSAPKSVSILYGVGDDELSAKVRDAHDRAVHEALGYVERHACWTRRGRGGRQHLQGDGLTVATFRHRTSRAGDPQLHTHAVVANATRADGRATALDGQALYAHARTAGYLYEAALRAQLTESVGVQWGPVRNGIADINGVPDEVIDHFAQRRREIRERMAQHGGHTMDSARIAALETRRAKRLDVPTDRLRDEWRARASEHGLDQHQLADLLDRRMAGKPMQPDIAQAAESMTSPGGITHHASTFDRRDVLRDWSQAHREGATVERLERLADRWLASPHAVRLEDGGRRAHLGGARYSTPEMLRTEEELLTTSRARKGTEVALGSPAHLGTVAPAAGASDEQTALIEAVTRSGDGVQVIRAAAGTGKTRALHIARLAWEDAGVQVFGCALAARAAVELENLAGIDSTTVAHVERDLDQGYGLPRGSVLILDEAGMVGTRSIARLARHCADTDSKLLLVGDDRQLPEIDAGGAFRRLAKDLGAAELRTVWRQSHEWDREALDQLRHGNVADFAETYRDHGRLVAEPTATGLRKRLVEDWWHAARQPGDDAVMIAHRRVDVAELNSLARDLMREDHRLGEEEITTAEGRAFSIGDRVLAKQNDRRLSIVNGTRAEVVSLDQDRHSLEIRLSDGTTRALDSAYLDRGSLHHGYALTAHAAQGATVDRAFVLGSDDLYREWGYTALTRHREEARFYVVSPGSVERALPGLEPQPDPLTENVVDRLGRSGRKTAALDVLGANGHRPDRYERARSAALSRAVALHGELGETPWWKRRQRTELRRETERQMAAAAVSPTPMMAPTLEPAKVDISPRPADFRRKLNNPDVALVRTIGPRPSGLAGRDLWLRAATELVTSPELVTPVATLADQDLGLDL